MSHRIVGKMLILSVPLGLWACGHNEQEARSPSGYESQMTPASRSAPYQQQPGYEQQPGYQEQQPGYQEQQPGYQQQEQQQPNYQQPAPESESPGTTSGARSRALSEAQVATVASAIDRAEVEQARLAVNKADDDAVKDYARLMLAQHGQNLQDVNQLQTRLNLTPTDSQLASQLRSSSMNLESQLSQESGDDFDSMYIDHQIDQHRTALEIIDNQLLPSARREELKSTLQSLRSMVADHLQRAQQVKDKL